MLDIVEEFDTKPGYIEKLRTYFNKLRPNILKNHAQKYGSEKGCLTTTILPSLLDRQLKLSNSNLNTASMIEYEFHPVSNVQNDDLRKFLDSFEIKDTIPLVIINSVSTTHGYYMIVLGDTTNVIYSLESL